MSFLKGVTHVSSWQGVHALVHTKKVKFMPKERFCFKCLEPGHLIQECKDGSHSYSYRYKESTNKGNKNILCLTLESDTVVRIQKQLHFMTLQITMRRGNREG